MNSNGKEEMSYSKKQRTAQGAGTIRKRKDGRWEARYTADHNPGTGRQTQKSVYGRSKEEVRKKLSAATVDMDNGTWIEPSAMKVKDWAKAWISEYCVDVKKNTVIDYQSSLNRHILPALGEAPLQKLSKHHVQTFYNSLTREKGLSPKTVKNIHGCFHKMLNDALDLEYIKKNPADRPKLPRIPKPNINPLSQKEIAPFLKAAANDPYYSIFFVVLFTGLRISEAVGLTWDCVNFDNGILKVYRQFVKGDGGRWETLKNDKTRIIAPAPIVMTELQRIKREQEENAKVAGTLWLNTEDRVFTYEDGSRLIHCTINRHLKSVAAEIGRSDLRFHDLRHSFASASLHAGDDVKTLQENLGHHSAAFTLDLYGHVTDEMRKESSERMEKYIGIALNL